MKKGDAIYVVAMLIGAVISVVGNSYLGFMLVFISFIFLMSNMLLTKRYRNKWLVVAAIVFAILAIVMQTAAQFMSTGQ